MPVLLNADTRKQSKAGCDFLTYLRRSRQSPTFPFLETADSTCLAPLWATTLQGL